MMNLVFDRTIEKAIVFNSVRNYLANLHFTVINEEYRPWGGFFVIAEEESDSFIKEFFNTGIQNLDGGNKLSPKILIVAPGERLSWQYHHRRAEIWKSIGAPVGIIKSLSDEQGIMQRLEFNDTISLEQGERHRLVGLEGWGVIAEIWQHTDVANPSNENDIVRLEDDFGR